MVSWVSRQPAGATMPSISTSPCVARWCAEVVATNEKELAEAIQDKERFVRLDGHIGLTGAFQSTQVRGLHGSCGVAAEWVRMPGPCSV